MPYGSGVRHERLHHRVAWAVPAKALVNFALPPGELGGGHAGVDHVVHHIVHLAAEGIERGDGGAPRRRQEQKGVVKAAAGGSGFFLDVLLWGSWWVLSLRPRANFLDASSAPAPAYVVAQTRRRAARVLLRVPRPLRGLLLDLRKTHSPPLASMVHSCRWQSAAETVPGSSHPQSPPHHHPDNPTHTAWPALPGCGSSWQRSCPECAGRLAPPGATPSRHGRAGGVPMEHLFACWRLRSCAQAAINCGSVWGLLARAECPPGSHRSASAVVLRQVVAATRECPRSGLARS